MTIQARIPKIIHQTWKSKNVPRRFRRLQKTWLHHHPSWEYRLWTDEDNHHFIAQHYAWFLPIYKAYPEKIMQVDAVRYFILLHYGGVYVDLDCQCLQPLENLLGTHSLVLACEPPQHAKDNFVLSKGLKEIVCNFFLASSCGHDFWRAVIDDLVLYQGESHPLDATGPFMLSRTYAAYPSKDEIVLESHERVCPLDNARRHHVATTEDYPQAVMVHHWYGSWWRIPYPLRAVRRRFVSVLRFVLRIVLGNLQFCKRYLATIIFPQRANFYQLHCHLAAPPPHHHTPFYRYGSQLPCTSLRHGQRLTHSLVDEQASRDYLMQYGHPRISCLMITNRPLDMVKRSIHFFMRQSYPNKELLIVDDGLNNDIEPWLKNLNQDNIRYLHLPPQEKNLGELRNFAIRQAGGDYVCQWDDDDLHHAHRLDYQMSSLIATNADACFLHRQLFWLPSQRRLGICQYGLLENTILCKKEKAPVYLHEVRQEGTDPCRDVIAGCNTVFCDRPDLYVYFYHGGNTWGEKHFMRRWAQCDERYEGVHYDQALMRLSRLYDYDFGPQTPLHDHVPGRVGGGERSDKQAPSLLILIPAKNVAARLATMVKNIERTIYPRARMSLAILESDSSDGSYEKIKSLIPRLQKCCARVELFKKDFGYRRSFYPRWHPQVQYKRRQILARSRNFLLYSALRNEEWVLWIDADVQYWPAEVIDSLLSCGKDIVVPRCVRADGNDFDLNTFILKPEAHRLDWRRHIYDGLLQPPVGFGRHYLGDYKDHELVVVDGVGATMLLVRAELHRQGLNFPTFPLHHYIETGGLAEMARCMGYSCWGLPKVEIIHGDY